MDLHQLIALDPTKVKKSGDTMTGALTIADLANAINSADYPIQMMSGVASGIQNNSSSVFKIFGVAAGNDQIAVAVNNGSFGIGNTVGAGWAFGDSNTVSTSFALAVGNGNNVSGNGSVGLGLNNTTGFFAYNTAIGNGNAANGFAAVAIGDANTTGSVYAPVAIGIQNDALGNQSVAIGNSNVISGPNGVGIGSFNSSSTNNFPLMFGNYLNSTAALAAIIGSGVDGSNKLLNNVANSIYFGINSTVPTMIITDGGGVGGIGNTIAQGTLISESKRDVTKLAAMRS